jgi:hypothetical protein
MATTRENLDVENQTLIQLWANYSDVINDDSDIFDDTHVYDDDDTMYVDDRYNWNKHKYEDINPRIRRYRRGLEQSRVTKMNVIVDQNQRGIGRKVGNNKNIQLFNSSYEYPKNEVKRKNVRRNAYDPITKEQNFVTGKIRYMIDHWDKIVSVAHQEGAAIGSTNRAGQGDSDLKLHNLPGTDHTDTSAAGTSTPNRFKFGRGYRKLFLNSIDNPAERADSSELAVLGVRKFNEAQVLGGRGWGYTRDRGNSTGGFDFSSPAAFLSSTFDLMTSENDSRLDIARNQLENIREDIVQAYLPGFNRIIQPFHSRNSLNDYLQQNILLPPGTTRSTRPTTTDGEVMTASGPRPRVTTVIEEENTSTFATYKNLYVKNPVRPPIDSLGKLADPNRFDKGVISGVAIKDIERQGEAGVLKTANASTKQLNPIFSHEDHDMVRMTNDMKSRGFTQNIAHTVRGPAQGTLKPAVENVTDFFKYPGGKTVKNNAGDKQSVHAELGDLQFFPFLFTTENKVAGPTEGPFQQVCYLQATIDNLNESFAPNWQPKHFFGRTEQVQTYTNTERSIDISFLVHAPDMRSLQNLWERVSWLAQQTYGQYETRETPQPRLSNGPLLRMTIGDLYVGLPGFIRSLTYDWNALGQGGKWEMTQGIRMPMACKVQMSYSVIHDDNPDRNYNLYSGLTVGMIGDQARGRLIESRNDNNPINTLDSTYADLLDVNSSVGGERKVLSKGDDKGGLIKTSDNNNGYGSGRA